MDHNLYWNCENGENCYRDYVLPNWGIFNQCFVPTKIRITDIDGAVERKGHFLFFEVKQNTKAIPMGQRILFEKLTEVSNRITVILLYVQGAGKDMNIRESAVFWKGKMTENWTPTTTEEMQNRVRKWFLSVNQSQKT